MSSELVSADCNAVFVVGRVLLDTTSPTRQSAKKTRLLLFPPHLVLVPILLALVASIYSLTGNQVRCRIYLTVSCILVLQCFLYSIGLRFDSLNSYGMVTTTREFCFHSQSSRASDIIPDFSLESRVASVAERSLFNLRSQYLSCSPSDSTSLIIVSATTNNYHEVRRLCLPPCLRCRLRPCQAGRPHHGSFGSLLRR
jgi:hypothetical protein